jgi:hypothetical protein
MSCLLGIRGLAATIAAAERPRPSRTKTGELAAPAR